MEWAALSGSACRITVTATHCNNTTVTIEHRFIFIFVLLDGAGRDGVSGSAWGNINVPDATIVRYTIQSGRTVAPISGEWRGVERGFPERGATSRINNNVNKMLLYGYKL